MCQFYLCNLCTSDCVCWVLVFVPLPRPSGGIWRSTRSCLSRRTAAPGPRLPRWASVWCVSFCWYSVCSSHFHDMTVICAFISLPSSCLPPFVPPSLLPPSLSASLPSCLPPSSLTPPSLPPPPSHFQELLEKRTKLMTAFTEYRRKREDLMRDRRRTFMESEFHLPIYSCATRIQS